MRDVKFIKLLSIAMLLIVTTGCWDQSFLRDSSLAFSIAYDSTDDPNKIHGTTVIRMLKPIGGGQTQPYNIEVEASGGSAREIREEMNKITPGEYSVNKLVSILIGEELAKKNIYALLDVFYRVSANNISANLIVTKDKAGNILKMDYIKGALLSKALNNLLKSAEKQSLIPKVSLATLMPIMYDPGQDYILPYIEKAKHDTVKVSGIALFNDNNFTGKTINGQKGSMLLMMQGKEGSTAQFTFVDKYTKRDNPRNLTIAVLKSKRKINVKLVNGLPVYELSLKIDASITEYVKSAVNEKIIKDLNKYITKEFTKMINQNMAILQKANCDALGLGRELISKYPSAFKESEWKKTYKSVKLVPKVKVTIMEEGLIR